jgi:flagellar assembly protein FliH
MTTSFRRFAFDREYAADGTVLRDGDRVRRIFTEDEARAMADAAANQAAEGDAARMAETLRQISGRMQAVLARMDDESEAMRADAVRLALAAARSIAGAALDRYGADTIEACAREALAELRAEPRLAVRVAPHLVEEIAERLDSEAARLGFEGAVIVRADADVGAGDVVLEWRAGAVERTAADIEQRLEDTARKWLAAPAGDSAASSDAGAGGQAA